MRNPHGHERASFSPLFVQCKGRPSGAWPISRHMWLRINGKLNKEPKCGVPSARAHVPAAAPSSSISCRWLTQIRFLLGDACILYYYWLAISMSCIHNVKCHLMRDSLFGWKAHNLAALMQSTTCLICVRHVICGEYRPPPLAYRRALSCTKYREAKAPCQYYIHIKQKPRYGLFIRSLSLYMHIKEQAAVINFVARARGCQNSCMRQGKRMRAARKAAAPVPATLNY
jgi:hypothetical protein